MLALRATRAPSSQLLLSLLCVAIFPHRLHSSAQHHAGEYSGDSVARTISAVDRGFRASTRQMQTKRRTLLAASVRGIITLDGVLEPPGVGRGVGGMQGLDAKQEQDFVKSLAETAGK